jgi:hypothetical protein
VTRVSSLAGLAVAATVLLTGCGAVPDLNPGVAVRVDDTSFTLDEVEDVASSYCAAVETQLQDGEQVANAVINAQAAAALALQTASEQFAADEGVEPDATTYGQAQQQLEGSIAELSSSQQEAVRTVNLARAYAAAVQLAVGKQGGATTDEDAASAGQEAFAGWLDDQDVRIDPRFAVSLDGGAIAPTDTSVSYSVSSAALDGVAAEPDPTYAAGLPSTQRCG